MDGQLQQSHLPVGTREHTFLIYDRKSGEIVHGHKEVVLPGIESPSTDVLSRLALEYAAEVSKRDASSLRALAVESGELEPGTHYSVDVDRARLRRVQAKP